MTDPLTDDEREYYVNRAIEACSIAQAVAQSTNELDPLIMAVFGKIASPLYFLRQEEQWNQGVEVMKQTDAGWEKPVLFTRFRQSKAPDAEGYTEFAREDDVKTDLLGVLQYLRNHPDARKRVRGYVYKISDYNQSDWLWRKKESPK